MPGCCILRPFNPMRAPTRHATPLDTLPPRGRRRGRPPHPDDERFAHLVGRTAILPLVGRELPVIADAHVRPEFGTGCLKITPGHDPADFEIGRRHGLPEIGVIGEDGRMTAQAGERYAGLTGLEARKRVVEDLGDAVRAREPYTHEVP